MLRNGTEYVDAGPDYYEQQYRHRVMKNLVKGAQLLGYKLVQLEPDNPSNKLQPAAGPLAVT